MATALVKEVRPASLRHGLPVPLKREGTVYAIAFDTDTEQLRLHYREPDHNAALEIRRVLKRHQFQWQQGSVYFGGPGVNVVTVTVAVIDLTTQLPWFASSVRDIRMLRIEELNDMLPLVRRAAGLPGVAPPPG